MDRWICTVVIPNAGVKVDGSLDHVAVFVLEVGAQHVAVFETDFFGGCGETHCD